MIGSIRRHARRWVSLVLVGALSASMLVGIEADTTAAAAPGNASDLPPLPSARDGLPTPEVPEGSFTLLPPTASQLGPNPPQVIPVEGCEASVAKPGSGTKPTAPAPATELATLGNAQGGAVGKSICGNDADRKQSHFDPATSVRDEALTTDRAEVFRNADGTKTAAISVLPKRAKDASGKWADIDLDLVPAADGASPKNPAVPITIPKDPKEGVVRVDTPNGPAVLRIPSMTTSLAPVETAAESGVFRGATPQGPQVRIRAVVSGFEQDFVIADARQAVFPEELVLPKGVTIRQVNGGIELLDGMGMVIARFGGGHAVDDAKVDPVFGSGAETPVYTRLVGVDGNVARLEVSVDVKWLQDEARQFPVVVDPI